MPASGSLYGRLALPAGLPEHVAAGLVGPPREDEQEVGEPVEVLRGQRVDGLTTCIESRPAAALSPPDDSPGRVQQGSAWSTPRQDEATQRWQALVMRVAGFLQGRDIVPGYPERRVGRVLRHGITEVGAKIE